MTGPMRIGLDIGGTKTDAVAVTDDGRVTARVRLATGWGPAGIVETVWDALAHLERAGVDAGAIRSVGIGMPGQVGADARRVLHAVNLGVTEIDIAAVVGPRLGVPVAVENDVKAAALGAAALRGQTAGPDHRGATAYLNLGTGIAAGIVRGGALWRGMHGSAGEIGHITVDPNGPLCRCGQHGCVEALAGGASIARRWGRPDARPVQAMMDAADAGDPDARRLRHDLMIGVAAAVRILVLTVDVEVVILGGGLVGLGRRLIDGVLAELDASAEASAFMRSLRLRERVEPLPAGSPAAAFGAALVGAAHAVERATHG